MTATSLVPPPMSTTIEPLAASTGSPAPMAAAIGSSISATCRAPADRHASSTARCSTLVIPDGAHITTRGRANLRWWARRRKYRSICSEVATTTQPAAPEHAVASFAKALFLGEIHEDLVFPFPKPDDAEQQRIRGLVAQAREFKAGYDPLKAEEARWIGDDTIAELGERGLLGLYVPTEYGGQGLTQTGYCRVSEEFAQIDATLSVIMGVHQSIGMKGIVLFGTDEQKERFLPDLASGRKLAAFALTEPEAGPAAYHLRPRAVRQSDGSWLLNGEKRYIGNGSKAGVIVTFARTDDDGHVALILEPDMDGFEVGERFDTMGLRANDLRRLSFKDVRVPPENVLGEPGEGFRLAMHILNNGRLSLGTGSVGAAKAMLDLAIAHVRHRCQFGRPLADFELVREKIAWMVAYLFGLESMAYLTTG